MGNSEDKSSSVRMAKMRKRKKLEGMPDLPSVNLQMANAVCELSDEIEGMEKVFERTTERLVKLGYDPIKSAEAVRRKLVARQG